MLLFFIISSSVFVNRLFSMDDARFWQNHENNTANFLYKKIGTAKTVLLIFFGVNGSCFVS